MKAHHLQKTTTTTTENPLYYDEYYTNSESWDYYFGDYGSFKVDHQTLIPLVLKLEKVHILSVVICFSIQFFHFLVLSRKLLRHDFVYLTLLGISFFNLFFNIAELIPVILESKIVYKIEEDCVGGRPFFHQRIVIWCHVISRITKKYSWILAVFLAGFRVFSLAQPMNPKVRVIRRTSLKVFMMCCVPCIVWYLPYLLKFKIERSIGCDFKYTPTSYRRFDIDIDPKFERFYETSDGYQAVVFGIIFWVLAMILSLQLKRNGMNIEKIVSKHKRDRSDNTTLLVISITVLFLLSTGGFALFFVITKFVLSVSRHPILQWYAYNFSSSITTLALIFTSSQFFICYCISSKYRRTVRTIFCKQEKSEIYFVRPSTTSSVSSKKTRPYLGLY